MRNPTRQALLILDAVQASLTVRRAARGRPAPAGRRRNRVSQARRPRGRVGPDHGCEAQCCAPLVQSTNVLCAHFVYRVSVVGALCTNTNHRRTSAPCFRYSKVPCPLPHALHQSADY